MADGQSIKTCFTIKESKSNAQIKSISYTDLTSNAYANMTHTPCSEGTEYYTLSFPETLTTYQYRIITGYAPLYNSVEYEPTNFYWYYNNPSSDRDSYGLLLSGVSMTNPTHNEVYDGTADWALHAQEVNNSDSFGDYNNINSVSDWRKDSSFGRKRDASLDGKIFTVSEFETIPWYYAPYYNGGHGGNIIYVSPHILTCNIDAVKEESWDTTIANTVNTGRITVEYTHNGTTEYSNIYVYIDERNCLGTYIP